MGQGLKREQRGPDVDIFKIIQIAQDTVIHLEVDEEQWKITQGCQRQANWVWSPRTMSGLPTASRYSSWSTSNTTIHAFRPENNVGVSSQPMNDTRLMTHVCFASNKPRWPYFFVVPAWWLMYWYSSLSDPICFPCVAPHQFISTKMNLTYIQVLVKFI